MNQKSIESDTDLLSAIGSCIGDTRNTLKRYRYNAQIFLDMYWPKLITVEERGGGFFCLLKTFMLLEAKSIAHSEDKAKVVAAVRRT